MRDSGSTAVEAAFGADIDFAMLVKLYGHDQENERRYNPAQCIGAIPTVITGRPDPSHISTSYVARQDWERAHINAPLHAAVKRLQR